MSKVSISGHILGPEAPQYGKNGPKSGKIWRFGPFNCLFRNLLRISDRLIYNMTLFGIFLEFHYFGVEGARGPKERGRCPGRGGPKFLAPAKNQSGMV